MNLSLKFPVGTQHRNKKMNSPRFKLLKQATAIENIEQKLKQKQQDGAAGKPHNDPVAQKMQNEGPGQKKDSPANFIQLKHSQSNKLTGLCQDNARYSY